MKKEYLKPEHRVVFLQHTVALLGNSMLSTTTTNLDDEDEIIFGDGGNVTGR